MIDVRPHRNGHLASPVRNRYFYGKLLDVDHLEREQHYFLEGSRLINRLTLGAGVLCGLSVRERNGKVVIGPGVAVDGFGREIVVTEPFEVENPWELTDECGDPTGETREDGPVVLCLAYHECLVEPAPVLVSDCDVRETCEHGAVRERFCVLVHSPDDVEPPRDPTEPGRWRPQGLHHREPLPRAVAAEEILRAYGRVEAGVRELDRPTGLRERLCAAFQPSCDAGPHCVPLALMTRNAEGTVVVDPCAVRTTVYSNAVLLDLILCLAEEVERCCNPRVTVTAPVVKEVYPGPAQTLKVNELREEIGLEQGGFAISFSREMNADRLAAPEEWLRLVGIADLEVQREEATTVVTRAFPLAIELDHTDPTSLDGSEGFTAYYGFKPIPGTGSRTTGFEARRARDEGAELTILDLLGDQGIDQIRILVLARSDDVTQIVDAEDAPELLDADYEGTRLSPQMLDLLWDLGSILPALPPAITNAVGFPAGEAPPALPSGNGIEGGVFHSYFDVAT
jgi:hypothetical protein